MKKFIASLLISTISIFLISIISSLILSSIHFFADFKMNEIFVNTISIVLFFIAGITLGIIIKKQGLKYSLIFCLVYLLVYLTIILINKSFTGYKLMILSFKCISYTLGCILGVNLKK